MTKFDSIKRFAKRLLPVAVLSMFALGGAMSASAADGPVFNDNAQDYPTLQVRKTGTATWGTSANVAVGDTVDMLVWVHNNRPDTTAVNTRARVSLPAGVRTTHTATGTVWADNAAAKSSSVSVATGSESALSYVQNSARLFKNVNGTLQEVSWSSSVNKNDIVSQNGVSLGNVQGCWDYVQAVLIQVHVDGTTPGINTNKKVALTGGSTFADEATANPGDAVQYKIFVENTGTGTGRQPQVVDVLDARTSYISGSSYVLVKQDNNDYRQEIPEANIQKETLADGRTKLTYQFTDMAPRPDTAFYLLFQVRVADASKFQVGENRIPNVATASFADGTSKQTNQTIVKVIKEEAAVVRFTLVKQVRNATNNDTVWKGELSGSAGPNDEVEFKLSLTNTGNTVANNVTLKDVLPQGMTFVPGSVRLYNKTTGDAGISLAGGDALVGNGYVFNKVENGTLNQQFVTFKAKLTDVCSGTQTLVNTGQVFWEGQKRAEDTARVIYSCNRGLLIQKDVKTAGRDYADDGGIVTEGTVVTYRIIVTNNGNVTVNNPVLRDVLPANVTYVNNSMRIDREVTSAAVQNGFFNQGVTLTNFTPGMTKEITFDVRVNDCPDLGDHLLVNTAFVRADGVAEKSDTAVITVRVTRPDLI